METIFIRTPYNYDRDEASNIHGLECKDPSLAQQQFKDQSDLNVLFAKYLETGEMPQIQETLTYGNFEGVFDFQSAMNAVRAAQETFDQLPARIKNRFDNDPQKLLQFMNDDENREEAIFLKLIEPPKESPNEPGSQETTGQRTDAPPQPAGTDTTPRATEGTKKP